jgi:prevent-host-death family protein
MSTEISYRDFRDNLADVLNRIEYRDESFTITRRGKPVASITPHSSRYGTTYAYRIDVTEDGETWMPYRDDARGIEKAFMDPLKLANLILTNHLADIRTNGEPDSGTRVLVWRDTEGLDTEAVTTAEYNA